MVIGYSTHLYLPIRAAQHPAINEGNPSNWNNLRDLLERKQYGQTSMFVRRGPLSAQLDKEFWRYWKRQWPLTPSPRLDEAGSRRAEPRWFQYMLPMLLGLAGLWWNRRDRTSFLTMGCLFLFSTAVMIAFLNFTDHEVRDRDYFYTTGYHVYALWIGMGVAWLVKWVWDSFTDEGQRRWATAASVALLAVMPVLLARSLWWVHDRRGNYVARDYAYNMLQPLAPNSFLFTNGDNDTFPLWYIQQVEGVRKDVRVVNMSLLNTGWYIRQLRDEEPRVPITVDDQAIDESLDAGALRYAGRGRSAAIDSLVAIYGRQGAGLSQEGYVINREGRAVFTNEAMVHHIISTVRGGHAGPPKQPYFAVTVPEHAGYDPYFSLEGLVYRVNPDSLQDPVDEPKTRNAVYHTFLYRGLFNPDGSWDTRVYKDENAATLSRNYAAAHLQLAFWYRRHGELNRSIAEMERVARMFPDYTEVLIPLGGFYMDQGDTLKAMELFRRLASHNPNDPEARYYYGVTLLYQGQLEPGIKEFEASMALDPNYNLPYYGAYLALWDHHERERALTYLELWVSRHPDDEQARQLLTTRRREVGGGTMPVPGLPQPAVPGTP
jgi:tetratricopeptide (TPR) repeat protein